MTGLLGKLDDRWALNLTPRPAAIGEAYMHLQYSTSQPGQHMVSIFREITWLGSLGYERIL